MKRWKTGFLVVFLIFAFQPYLPATCAQEAEEIKKPIRRDFTLWFEEFLDLKPEQKARLEEWRKVRREEREVFVEKMRASRLKLQEFLQDPEANQKEIEKLIDEMSSVRSTQMKTWYQRHQEFNKIFTSEQTEKLKNLRTRIAKKRIFQRGRFFDRERFIRQGPLMHRHRFSFDRRGGFRGFRHRVPWWE